jgi:hypothetical protein
LALQCLSEAELKSFLKKLIPSPVRKSVRRLLAEARILRFQWLTRLANKCGYEIVRLDDFYSPVPNVAKLEQNLDRWFKPSELAGVQFNLQRMKEMLVGLAGKYSPEFARIPAYREIKAKGFGPGFPVFDAMVLYSMVRELKPSRFIEIGSGLSTYYCWLAAQANQQEGRPVAMTSIDPYPSRSLQSLPGIEIIAKEVQDVELAFFDALQAGDILFVDSTHILKLDGDVPFLHLEVIPRVQKGVVVHVHDVPFPYNVPCPPEEWVLNRRSWPVFWNEAMLLQAFLSYNESFQVLLSAPLIRHFDEEFLRREVPLYKELEAETITIPCSVWIERVKWSAVLLRLISPEAVGIV